MAQPTPYDLAYDFVGYQTINPRLPLPANKLEIEFNAVAATLDQILANLALIQRDDTEIANLTIDHDQLSNELEFEVRNGFRPPTQWATATIYAEDDTVFFGSKLYRSLLDHTSTVFATDLGNAKWILVADIAISGIYLLLTGGTMAGAIDMADNLIEQPVIQDYALKAYTAAITAGALPLDFESGNVAKVTLDANVTNLTIANWPSELGKKHIFVNTGAGGFTFAFPAAWKWPGGTIPTITSTASRTDVFVVMTLDGGTTIFATVAGQNYG